MGPHKQKALYGFIVPDTKDLDPRTLDKIVQKCGYNRGSISFEPKALHGAMPNESFYYQALKEFNFKPKFVGEKQ